MSSTSSAVITEKIKKLVSSSFVINDEKEHLDVFAPCMRKASLHYDESRMANDTVQSPAAQPRWELQRFRAISVDGSSLSSLLGLQCWFSTMSEHAHTVEQVWFKFEKLDGEISEEEKAQIERLYTKAEVTNGQPRRINHGHIWESPIYPVEAQISVAIGHLLLALPSVKQVGFDKKVFFEVMEGPNFQPLPFIKAPSLTLVEESESPVSLSWQTILTLCQPTVNHLMVHGKINFDINHTRGQIQNLNEVTDITFDEAIMEGKGTRIHRAPSLEALRYLSPQAQGGGAAFIQFKTISESLALETTPLKMLCLSFPDMPESLVQYEFSSMLEKLSGFGISVPNPNGISTYNEFKQRHSGRLEIFAHKDGGDPVQTSAWEEMRGWKLANLAWHLS